MMENVWKMELVQLSEQTIRLLRIIIDERAHEANNAGVIPDYDRIILGVIDRQGNLQRADP
jgi:hypothetical protein